LSLAFLAAFWHIFSPPSWELASRKKPGWLGRVGWLQSGEHPSLREEPGSGHQPFGFCPVARLIAACVVPRRAASIPRESPKLFVHFFDGVAQRVDVFLIHVILLLCDRPSECPAGCCGTALKREHHCGPEPQEGKPKSYPDTDLEPVWNPASRAMVFVVVHHFLQVHRL